MTGVDLGNNTYLNLASGSVWAAGPRKPGVEILKAVYVVSSLHVFDSESLYSIMNANAEHFHLVLSTA